MKNIFQVIVVAVLISALIIGCFTIERRANGNLWNNGIHAKDGGSWVYDSFRISGGYSCFGYHCNVCGKTIHLEQWHQQ